MGFFPGDERGFNLAAGAVSFPHYAYTGLVKNEAESHEDWQCPFANSLYQGIVPGVRSASASEPILIFKLVQAHSAGSSTPKHAEAAQMQGHCMLSSVQLQEASSSGCQEITSRSLCKLSRFLRS